MNRRNTGQLIAFVGWWKIRSAMIIVGVFVSVGIVCHFVESLWTSFPVAAAFDRSFALEERCLVFSDSNRADVTGLHRHNFSQI